MAYQAIICKLSNVRPHSNADRLKIATVQGYQVVVSRSAQDGDLGIFFNEGGQLAHELVYNNNLYSHKEMNKDPEAKTGFFESSRRVRAQKFRGELSDGFWTSLDILKWAGDVSKLKDGDQLDTFNGYKICQKYYTPATSMALAKAAADKGKKSQQVEKYHYDMLHKHYDTKQARDNLHRIPQGAVLYVSEKHHGTSQRTGNINVSKHLRGFKKWWNNHFPMKFQTSQWLHVSGTRNTIMVPDELTKSSYVSVSYRKVIHDRIKSLGLKQGETLYYELVGFDENNKAIMSPHDIEDKALAKRYGSKMVYKYGCEDKTCRVLVYRITQTNEDGYSIDLSWPQIVSRCAVLGLETVTPLAGPIVYDGDKEALVSLLKAKADGPSTLDNDHIREGVVLRVEHPAMFDAFKFKGWVFCDLEGIRKNSDDFIDQEEIA